jgi:hypothetical protein
MTNVIVDPRMSMSGRLSTDQNPAAWAYGALPQYASDGTPNTHGRRSSIYRAQNSTLFNAFEEGDMPLTNLPEEEEDDSGDERDGPGRSLVGKNRGKGVEEGGRHPAYERED